MKTRYFFKLMIWAVFSPHKTKNYYYRTEKCGMIPFQAYEQSKYLTREVYEELTKSRK